VIELLVGLGYAGMALILLMFILVRKHFFRSQIIGLIGSMLLAIYADGKVPLVMLNIICALVCIYNLIKSRRDKNVKTTKA